MRSALLRAVRLPVALLFAALPAAAAPPDGPPETKVDSVKETIHGVEIADPYRWLENQDSPDTRAWIGAQNAIERFMPEQIAASSTGAVLPEPHYFGPWTGFGVLCLYAAVAMGIGTWTFLRRDV